MEELSVQTDAATLDKTAFVVLDIESLAQPSDRSSGSPKMTRALSRKWSYRAERWTGNEEEGIDETAKKLLIKVKCTPPISIACRLQDTRCRLRLLVKELKSFTYSMNS